VTTGKGIDASYLMSLNQSARAGLHLPKTREEKEVFLCVQNPSALQDVIKGCKQNQTQWKKQKHKK
jgi:hypothetical protein